MRGNLPRVSEVSAGGFVLASDAPARIALIGRKTRGPRLEWCVPKGHLEGTESAEQAAHLVDVLAAVRRSHTLGGTTVEVGYGHPLADELRAMGFPHRSLVTIFDDHMRATFEAPFEV